MVHDGGGRYGGRIRRYDLVSRRRRRKRAQEERGRKDILPKMAVVSPRGGGGGSTATGRKEGCASLPPSAHVSGYIRAALRGYRLARRCLRVIARGLSNNSAPSASRHPLRLDERAGGRDKLTDDWYLMKIRLPAGSEDEFALNRRINWPRDVISKKTSASAGIGLFRTRGFPATPPFAAAHRMYVRAAASA